MSKLTDLANLIESSNYIAIFAHSAPDADAFCSSLALKEIIQINYTNNKKRVDVYIPMPDGVPALYQPIVGDEVFNKRKFAKYDLAIALDSPNSSRFGEFELMFKKAKHSVNIDHHESNTSFAEHNFILPNYSSVSEMLFAISKPLNWKLTNNVAKHIYTGIITDTNCLTSSNVSKNTYKTLAELSSYQFDQDEIKNYFFKTNTKAKMFVLERALRSMKFYEDDKIALMNISNKDLVKFQATTEDTLGVVEHAINTEGVLVAGFVIEKEPNKFYVSLRSKGDIKVSEIAQQFDGGGHGNMAAFNYEGEYADLKPKLVNAFKEAVNVVSDNVEEEKDESQAV